MNEDFVSFYLAKKLKEKGFRYNKNNLLDRLCMENQINHPSISQVLKWLREEKKWNIEIYPVGFGEWEFHCTHIITLEDRGLLGKWNSYELTALAGIEYVIDNLM